MTLIELCERCGADVPESQPCPKCDGGVDPSEPGARIIPDPNGNGWLVQETRLVAKAATVGEAIEKGNAHLEAEDKKTNGHHIPDLVVKQGPVEIREQPAERTAADVLSDLRGFAFNTIMGACARPRMYAQTSQELETFTWAMLTMIDWADEEGTSCRTFRERVATKIGDPLPVANLSGLQLDDAAKAIAGIVTEIWKCTPASGLPAPASAIPSESTIPRAGHCECTEPLLDRRGFGWVCTACGRDTKSNHTPIASLVHPDGGIPVNAPDSVEPKREGKLPSERIRELSDEKLKEVCDFHGGVTWQLEAQFRDACDVRAVIAFLDERLGRSGT